MRECVVRVLDEFDDRDNVIGDEIGAERGEDTGMDPHRYRIEVTLRNGRWHGAIRSARHSAYRMLALAGSLA